MPVPVVILCGGEGTRIRDVADDVPKPMIRVGERPIVWHIMKLYAYYGIKDFVLCLGYKGWVIKEFFLNYQAYVSDICVTLDLNTSVQYLHAHPEQGWNITLAETGYKAQTGARINLVQQYIRDSDLFCVTYGDGVADIDITALIKFHRSHGRIATVTGVRPTGRFGVLTTEATEGVNIVSRFQEKPQASDGLINGGFFVFDHRVWNYLNDDENLIFEQQPLMNLARDGQLAVYEHTGFWQPMDTYREWKLLNELWASDKAPWKR